MSDFGIETATYPVVPEGPATLKLSSFVAELKEKLESVEFDATEKTLFPSTKGVTAKLTMVLAGE
jgi:hypothetical protein